jgi:hypothetical protein
MQILRLLLIGNDAFRSAVHDDPRSSVLVVSRLLTFIARSFVNFELVV